MTREKYDELLAKLKERPPVGVEHNGRTAIDVEQLDFIAKVEGLDVGEDAADPIDSQDDTQKPPAVKQDAFTTPSGLDAMTVGVSELVKANLVEVAQTLGIDPLPETTDDLRTAIKAKREELKAAL
jgi:hypothetical protein